eukprot:1141274-Lingulodinium_polyedra.AAC.2
MSRRTCRRTLTDLSAAVHFSNRVWASSLLNHIAAKVELGTLVPIAAFTYCLYDETPLAVRAAAAPAVASLGAVLASTPGDTLTGFV